MKNTKPQKSRRAFLRSSCIVFTSSLIPFNLIGEKEALGSSISIPISYKGKSLGLKITNINGEYLIGTIRVPESRKIVHFYIPGPSRSAKVSSKDLTIKLGKGLDGVVTADSRNASFSTTLKGAVIGNVLFNDSRNDNLPSSEGFFNWLKDKVADVGRAISAGLTYICDGTGQWFLSDGSTIEVGGSSSIKYSQNGAGFKAEPGLEDTPGVWY